MTSHSSVIHGSCQRSPPSMEFASCDVGAWREALFAYDVGLSLLRKPDVLPLDGFYRTELPLVLRRRDPRPFLTKPELHRLMQWKLTRGKWRSLSSFPFSYRSRSRIIRGFGVLGLGYWISFPRWTKIWWNPLLERHSRRFRTSPKLYPS